MGLSSGGMQLPLIVLYPLPPVIALVMIGKHAFKITSGVTIVTLVIFILLDLSGYHFDTLPIDSITTRIMRSFWLIFLIVVITITINYYVNKIEHLTLTLQSLAESDYVTGLPSRKMLDEALKREYYRAIRLHKGLSLLFVKVDRLNDLYDFAGQMMGDECLRLISGAIKDNFKRTTDYPGKYDSNEYLIILSDGTPDGALLMAERLRNSVEELDISIDNKSKKITVTIACITITELKSMNIDEILDKGNELISKMKTEAGNKVTAIEL